MSWKPLRRFHNAGIAKLDNLRRAARAGLRVPRTRWQHAKEVDPNRVRPPTDIPAPWIVRSASPTEDTETGTNAGQFVSRSVPEDDPVAFLAAARAVLDSLPRDSSGRVQGALFVQPLLTPEQGGVVFFDGFHFECTTSEGGNQTLTEGSERGEVVRGQLQRGDAFSAWLKRLARIFRKDLAGGSALDIEFARDGDRCTVLQVRPARFPLRRNPLLSQANHREILGDLPSPWVASALEAAGADALNYFAEVEPEVGSWNERYAVVLAGRAWLNFSFFFRLMDHWGLPRTFVTEGVGGESDRPQDSHPDLRRILRKSPRLLWLQAKNLLTILQAKRDLAAFERRVQSSTDLESLHSATAYGLGVALRTNFAINGALTGVVRLRKWLGIRGRARVTTEAMMEDYDALRNVPPEGREGKLDGWLAKYGHRGPLESDPARPRFAELREVLLADLKSDQPITGSSTSEPSGGWRPFFALDRRRESFRDELMRIWQDLRRRILEAAIAAGFSDPEDVFLFSGPPQVASSLEARRAEQADLARIELPNTATRAEIEERLQGVRIETADENTSFSGVSLSDATFEGKVRRAEDLVRLLRTEQRTGTPLLDQTTVLVVRALEPSWAVVLGRVGAVVTELGGELSHASILLREARKPAIVNCSGIFDALVDGERVRLEGGRGVVQRVA